jgi:hypothetical protein
VPSFKIETSLFEPVTIEVEGGRTFTSVPVSPGLLREVDKLRAQRLAGTLEDTDAIIREVSLIFGVDPKDIETTDIRVLKKLLDYAMDTLTKSLGGAPKAGEEPAAAGVVDDPAVKETAEKNGSEPAAAPSLS